MPNCRCEWHQQQKPRSEPFFGTLIGLVFVWAGILIWVAVR